MSLDQHTSVVRALEFGYEPRILQAIGTSERYLREPIHASILRGIRYQNIVARILDKPRTGWTLKERGIPEEYRETIGAHMVKVAIAAWELPHGLVKWHELRGESPSRELHSLYMNMQKRLEFVRHGFFHDFCEWGDYPDILPWAMEEKDKINKEKAALEEYARQTGDFTPLVIFLKLQRKTFENKLLHNLDKLDPAIMALNYEKEIPKADVYEFYPYTSSKMQFPLLREILETLIRYRDDYPLDMFVQYLSLLRNGGDVDIWRRDMDEKSSAL